MNFKLFIALLVYLPLISFGQGQITNQIDSLQFIDDMPYICRGNVENNSNLNVGCGDKTFWNIVKQKEKAIPFLLNKLNETTMTKAIVPNFGYNYRVADIAYTALSEIVHGIPTFKLLGIEFDKEGCGYCAYWENLNENYQHRIDFRLATQNWYKSNKNKLVWVVSDSFSSCDCSNSHPNHGHYELKE